MKNILLILIVLICKANFAFTQVPQDSVDYYIKNIGWESLYLKTTYATELVLNKEAEKLTHSKGQKTVDKLFSEISNAKKVVVIHMILSRMFEPESSKLDGKYIYKNDSVVTVNYTYNTLKWRFEVKKGRYTIEPDAIKKIKDYWKAKLALMRNKSKPDWRRPIGAGVWRMNEASGLCVLASCARVLLDWEF